MIVAAILAGGVGSRMQNENLPKQFMPIGSKPIIMHTIEKFLLSIRLETIYIGVHPSWTSFMDDMLQKYIKESEIKRIRIVEGGSNRSETLFNVLDAFTDEFGESDSHITVTHDAVRPFVSLRIIDENIDAALLYGACNTVIPATDTIVESEDGEVISRIPKRSTIYQGQTPQSFNVSKLKYLYGKMSDDQKMLLTDACRIYTDFGEPVHMVMGETLNFKITTINDYRIAQSILNINYD